MHMRRPLRGGALTGKPLPFKEKDDEGLFTGGGPYERGPYGESLRGGPYGEACPS